MNKNRNIIRWWLCVALLIASLQTAFAQYASVKVQPRRTNPIMAVNDFADILTPNQEMALEMQLRRFYDTSSNEIVLVTLNSLNDFAIDDVTYAYFKSWKIGDVKKDNGILVLMAKNDRKLRIEVGKGLEGALPDGLAGSIIRNEISPLFKAGDYYNGFNAGINAIMKASKGEYKPPTSAERRGGGGDEVSGTVVIFLLIFFLFLMYLIYKNRNNRGGGMLTRRGYRQWGGPTIFDFGPWSGGSSSGGWSSGGGGGLGDFGGWGGGESGGGGASGDW
jgi:uncharacterized protein